MPPTLSWQLLWLGVNRYLFKVSNNRKSKKNGGNWKNYWQLSLSILKKFTLNWKGCSSSIVIMILFTNGALLSRFAWFLCYAYCSFVFLTLVVSKVSLRSGSDSCRIKEKSLEKVQIRTDVGKVFRLGSNLCRIGEKSFD